MFRMFRISRLRVRWIDPEQPPPASLLASSRRPGLALERLAPWSWRIQVKWAGFGPLANARPKRTTGPARLLRSFDLPTMKVRVSWIGAGSPGFRRIGILAVLAACLWLGLFALTRPGADQPGNPGSTLNMEKIDPAGLVSLEVNLSGRTMRMTHSPLDIGQAPDAFDNNLETLIRGRQDNPFILDFDFSEPQPITGLAMDFGRMDFILRVQVYGTDEAKPVLYEGEYRAQPDIPHAEIDFSSGPAQVRRIYIEVEQLNPPEEVHVHIREVVFKE
jgi:hypothetical protein